MPASARPPRRPVTAKDAGPSQTELLEGILTELRASNHLLAVLAVRDLEPRRAILVLDAAGLTAARIGEAVGMTANAVRVALHRARKSAPSNVTLPHADGGNDDTEA